VEKLVRVPLYSTQVLYHISDVITTPMNEEASFLRSWQLLN